MKDHDSAAKAATAQHSSAGPNGAKVQPPSSGIDVVDSGMIAPPAVPLPPAVEEAVATKGSSFSLLRPGLLIDTPSLTVIDPILTQFIMMGDYDGLKALRQSIALNSLMNLKQAGDAGTTALLGKIDAAIETLVRVAFLQFPMSNNPNIGFPRSTAERIEFLEVLGVFLGSPNAVIKHYQSVEYVREVPTEIYMHRSAAQQIRKVAAELEAQGQVMPAASNALGIRDRYHAHQRQSNSLMAHPMGYAIDFRPLTNPMIQDKDLATLLRLNMDGSDPTKTINMQIGGYEERRGLIEKLGSGEIKTDDERVKPMFTQFHNEFIRLQKASAEFVDKVGGSVSDARLKEEQSLYFQSRTKRAQVIKERDTVTNKLDKTITPKLAQVDKQLADLKTLKDELPRTLKATTKAKTRKKLEDRLSGLPKEEEALTKSRTALADEQTKLQQQKESLTGSLTLLDVVDDLMRDELKKVLAPVTQRIQQKRAQLTAQLPSSKNPSKEETQRAARINKALKELDALEQRLGTDLDFVLGRGEGFTVNRKTKEYEYYRSPPVVQLLKYGFFTPDAAPGPGEKQSQSKHGFNELFMQTMMKHGFDLGIAWSETNLDAMHFELVAGVDHMAVNTPRQRSPLLENLQQQFHPKKSNKK